MTTCHSLQLALQQGLRVQMIHESRDLLPYLPARLNPVPQHRIGHGRDGRRGRPLFLCPEKGLGSPESGKR